MHHFLSFVLRIAYACFFGFVMLMHTAEIVKYVPQLLGALLMLESITQLIELFALKFKTQVHWGFFATPFVILLYGLYLFFCCTMPENLNNIFMELGTMFRLKVELKLTGICFLAFILSEFVISIAFYKPMFQPKKFAEEKAKQKEAQRALEEERARQEALEKANLQNNSL